MGDIYFTSNPAEWRRLPGVYIDDRDPPGFIRGVDLSTIGMFGKAAKGPTTLQSITSYARFVEIYGEGYLNGVLVGEMWKALQNKSTGALVCKRVVAAAAVAATVNLDDTAGVGGTNVLKVDANFKGIEGNNVTVSIEAATSGVATSFNLRAALHGKEQLWKNISINSTDNNIADVMGDDLSNFIVATKLANGRPHNQAATALVSGADGSLAASDYVAALAEMAAYQGVDIVLCPESLEATVTAGAQATLNAAIVARAAEVVDRIFLTWSGKLGDSVANEVTAVGAQITTRSDRVWWCFNVARTLDPVTATLIDTAPHVWLASILTQVDVDIHPGAVETQKLLAGVVSLYNESLSRGDLISLREAGISTLEKLRSGFQFRDVVTTDLTPGKTEGVRRREADFLQLSASDRLRYFVKAKNIVERRAQMVGELVAFSDDLRGQGRIIEDYEVISDAVNTVRDRAEGIEKILWRVKLIGHILSLVLSTEIGTGVVIESAAA